MFYLVLLGLNMSFMAFFFCQTQVGWFGKFDNQLLAILGKTFMRKPTINWMIFSSFLAIGSYKKGNLWYNWMVLWSFVIVTHLLFCILVLDFMSLYASFEMLFVLFHTTGWPSKNCWDCSHFLNWMRNRNRLFSIFGHW